MNVEDFLPITDRLKADTLDAHARVEALLPYFKPGFDLGRYARFLAKQLPIYRCLERSLEASPFFRTVNFDLTLRKKSALLEFDLERLRERGCPTDEVEDVIKVPDTRREKSILGILYVLEGATLGGQIIAKLLYDRWQLLPNSGAAFYNCYGLHQMDRWREFREFLLTHADAESHDTIVNAAKQTFDCFSDGFTA